MPPGERAPGFAPGVSGNPGGRARVTPDMQKAKDNSRAASPEMVEVLLAIARNAESDDHARIKAANSVLDRALGKPEQSITGADGAPLLPEFNTRGMSDADLGNFLRTIQRIRVEPVDPGGTGEVGTGSTGGSGGPASGESPP